MLSTTYFLTAISIEQKRMHKILTEFQQYIQEMQTDIAARVKEHYSSSVADAMQRFSKLEKYCHTRKVDTYLIPAIHHAKESDKILSEIELLKSSSMNLFMDMQAQFITCVDNGVAAASEICNAMKKYCDIQQAILFKEENELLPAAQRWLPLDVWFSMAAKCLKDQEERHERERAKIHAEAFEIVKREKIAESSNMPAYMVRERMPAMSSVATM